VLDQFAHVVDYKREYLYFADEFTEAMKAGLRLIDAWDVVAKKSTVTVAEFATFVDIAQHKTDSVARDAVVFCSSSASCMPVPGRAFSICFDTKAVLSGGAPSPRSPIISRGLTPMNS
jgi:hypothetical protein